MEDSALVFFAGVLVLGAAAQWVAWRLRLPSILLLLAMGFALGSFFTADQLEKLLPHEVLFPVVSLSVGIILFEGGLTLQMREVIHTGRIVARLVIGAVAVTWILAAAACVWLLDFDWPLALLAGAIFTVSGPTVVGPLLRHIRPRGRLGAIVKWEGIVNDPIGALLAVLVFTAVFSGSLGQAVGHLLGAIAVGTLAGLAAGWLAVAMLRRYWVPDFLHVPFFVGAVVITFAFANYWQHESGLVAVTVLGFYLANQRAVALHHVVEFKENLRVLLISSLFIVLASRLQFEQVKELGAAGAAFIVVLILLIRPAAVLLSTLGADVNWRERLFLSFLAPRGIVAVAVSSVFALTLAELKREGTIAADLAAHHAQLVPLTFLVIIGTVSVYGLLAAPLARWLDLSESSPQGVLFAGADPWLRPIAKALQEEGFAVMLVDLNHRNIAAARMAGLPTCHANILSEYVQEELDLGGIGRLLACTSNSDINSLATLAFGHHFGRAGVFQLPREESSARKETAPHMHGRLLFSHQATYAEMVRRFYRQDQVKKTRLTEEFTYEDFKQMYGESALLLFRIQEPGKKLVACTTEEAKVKAGETVIALVQGEREN